jgi:tripartite-type tricarboxylate transporter receptor subunit TctC
MRAAGIQMTHVPYKGMPPAVTDHHRWPCGRALRERAFRVPAREGGQGARASASRAEKASPVVPDLPVDAAGGREGLSASSSGGGILAPPKTPPEIVNAMNAEVNRIVATPEIREVFLREGAEPAIHVRAAVRQTIKTRSRAGRRSRRTRTSSRSEQLT